MTQPAGIAKPYVFLSYTSPDRARVLTIADALEAAGVRVWLDRRSIPAGSSWDAAIVRAIRDCTVFLVHCTEPAMRSSNVQQEIRLALEERRPVVPLLAERITFPDEVRYALAGLQWVELLDRPTDEWLAQLLEALGRLGFGDGRGESAAGRSEIAPPDPTATAATAADHFPAAHSLPPTVSRSSLPAPLTRLIGRERELGAVHALLTEHRLVTLTGPGGSGKTRLALAVAAASADRVADGVAFVALAPLQDPALIPAAIAAALDVREAPGRPLLESVVGFLQTRSLLLVLDNCEHLLAGIAVVGDLLQRCSDLVVLATSRAPLHLAGEMQYPVPPLPLLDTTPAAPASLGENPAVVLFCERVQAVRPDFRLTAELAPAIVAICRRLDGLPLALELAAARCKLLTPQALLARLAQRLPVLTGGPRDAPARQQTLRDTIGWSYESLSTPEQALFRRLAVFVGGWSFEAAEAVSDPAGDLDVFEGLATLVDQSLVHQIVGPEGEPRFSMLQTMREFALEQLAAYGDHDAVHRQYAGFFAALAEQAEWELVGAAQRAWLARLAAERDNLQAAVAWTYAQGEAELGLRIVGALSLAWYYQGPWSVWREWALRLLALPSAAPRSHARAKALYTAGGLTEMLGDYPRAHALLRESVATWRELGDRGHLFAHALILLGATALDDVAAGTAACVEGVALARETGRGWTLAMGLANAGYAAVNVGDPVRARPWLAEAEQLARTLDDPRLMAFALIELGCAAIQQGDVAAGVHFAEGLALARAADDTNMVAYALIGLGTVALAARDQERAALLLAESLQLSHELGTAYYLTLALEGWAGLCSLRGQATRAARFYGAAAAARAPLGLPVPATFVRGQQQRIAGVRTQLGEQAYDAARAAGEALTLEEAVAEALVLARDVAEVLPAPTPPASPVAATRFPDGLTAREVEVLRLIATGLSSHEIAVSLVISEGTVSRHVTNLYGKIGARGRADATAYAFRHNLAAADDAPGG